jgi:drug/metabolite transporter (DMT)-like permease
MSVRISSNNTPAVYPLVSALFWGGMFAVLARALRHVDVFNLSAVRYGLATLVFVAILVVREGVGALRPGARAAEVAVLGVVGFAGFNLLLGLALGRINPQNAALMVVLAPLLTVLVRWVRDKARPGAATLALVGVALVGVVLVITKGHPALGNLGLGDLLMFGGVASWAVYTHGATRFTDWSPLRYATLTAVTGTAGIFVLTAAVDVTGAEHVPALGDVLAVWPEIAYVALLGAVVAVLAWNVGVRRLGASNAALFLNLVPVIALGIAAVNGYRPGAVEYAGIALTVGAIVATNLLARQPAVTSATRYSIDPATG